MFKDNISILKFLTKSCLFRYFCFSILKSCCGSNWDFVWTKFRLVRSNFLIGIVVGVYHEDHHFSIRFLPGKSSIDSRSPRKRPPNRDWKQRELRKVFFTSFSLRKISIFFIILTLLLRYQKPFLIITLLKIAFLQLEKKGRMRSSNPFLELWCNFNI